MAKRRYDTEDWAEQAAPSTPPAGFLRLYPGTDHKLHIKDSTGLNEIVPRPVASRLYAAANLR